jgi:hypothetical protein
LNVDAIVPGHVGDCGGRVRLWSYTALLPDMRMPWSVYASASAPRTGTYFDTYYWRRQCQKTVTVSRTVSGIGDGRWSDV